MIKRTVILPILIMFASLTTNAQIEVSHLRSKGFSATGFGAFLNFAVPVSEYGYITAEAAFYYFGKDDNNVAIVPFLLGYRHMLQDDPDAGFYVEPCAGYTIGATDIQKYDDLGRPIPDNDNGWLEQQAKGFSAGIGTGYIIPGGFPLNIGLRYQRVFVSNDPSLNLFSLRLSYPLSFRKREY